MAVRLESHYTIAWIAPLPHEHAAAKTLLDDRHDTPDDFYHPTDDSSYTWGRMGKHNIVIVSLPAGTKNLVSASVTASNLVSSLPHIRIGLLVGIRGGIPCQDLGHDIRLGDVVVSQPQGTSGGVVQYDQGRAHSNQTWELKGSLNMPPAVLLNGLANLQSEHEIADSKIPAILQAMHTANPRMNDSVYRPGCIHQNSTNDKLFKPGYPHIGGECCSQCDESGLIGRVQRESTNEIRVWSIRTGECVQTIYCNVLCATLSYDSSLVAWTSRDDSPVQTQTRETEVDMDNSKTYDMKDAGFVIAISSDHEILAAFSGYGDLRLWSLETGESSHTVNVYRRRVVQSPTPLSLAFTNGSKILAYSRPINQRAGKVGFMRVETGQVIRHIHLRYIPTSLPFDSESGMFSTNMQGFAVLGTDVTDRPAAYDFDEDLSWITRDGRRLIWLPEEYRPSSVTVDDIWDLHMCATSSWTVAYICQSGRVVMIRFSM